MATDTLQPEPALATAQGGTTVLPFPQTPAALERYHTGMDTAGLLSLLLLERDGKPIPENVQRFVEPNGVELPERSPALLLALCFWGELPAKKRERITNTLSGMTHGTKPDRFALRLHNLPTGRR